MRRPSITLIGGGLVGALQATLLAQRGFTVEVFEKRPDPRRSAVVGGRSINLALAERGLLALRKAGCADAVLARAVMMRGRMVHPENGAMHLQRYGVDDREVIWSVSRATLNAILLDAAEAAGARVHFGQALTAVDAEVRRVQLTDADGRSREREADLLIGADGAGSGLRTALAAHVPLGERIVPLGHAYKELEIPPRDRFDASSPPPGEAPPPFAIEPNALHIWPRGGYMCIALPNAHGSFTVTLFLPAEGTAPSFATLPDAATATAFFRSDFPDLLPLLPDFTRDWSAHPVGTLATLYLQRWHVPGRALLIGDAAHAIVPFHGQGMNCGFEDAIALSDLLGAGADDPASAFEAFQRQRQPNTDAIAEMALENYVEMRDAVADPDYLLRRELGNALAERAPTHFMARYRMVSFTDLPYAYALARGRTQDAFVNDLLGTRTASGTIDLGQAVVALKQALPPIRAHAGGV